MEYYSVQRRKILKTMEAAQLGVVRELNAKLDVADKQARVDAELLKRGNQMRIAAQVELDAAKEEFNAKLNTANKTNREQVELRIEDCKKIATMEYMLQNKITVLEELQSRNWWQRLFNRVKIN